MDPYEVLGVTSTASDAEIKAAYRSAVKRHHPDKTQQHNTDLIAAVNNAYGILSDPQKRQAYDNRFNWVIEEEDPREVYKREYLRRKAEAARAQREWEKSLFRKIYRVNIWITAIVAILALDEFLPTLTYEEPVVDEWTEERIVKRQRFYVHYMQTPHFTLVVPQGERISREDFGHIPIMIKASPVFRIPIQVIIDQWNKKTQFKPARTVFSFAVPVHYILLVFCFVALWMRQYNSFSFSFSFAPGIVFVLMIGMFYFLT